MCSEIFSKCWGQLEMTNNKFFSSNQTIKKIEGPGDNHPRETRAKILKLLGFSHFNSTAPEPPVYF